MLPWLEYSYCWKPRIKTSCQSSLKYVTYFKATVTHLYPLCVLLTVDAAKNNFNDTHLLVIVNIFVFAALQQKLFSNSKNVQMNSTHLSGL